MRVGRRVCLSVGTGESGLVGGGAGGAARGAQLGGAARGWVVIESLHGMEGATTSATTSRRQEA
jgi:hypothetical protein